MPLGFINFDSGCPGLPSLGFVFDESGCEGVSAVECCYDNLTGVWSTAVSSGGSISFVHPTNHTFWCTSSEASGFGSPNYPLGPLALWKLWKPDEPTGPNCLLTDITNTEAVLFTGHVADIQSTQANTAGRNGHSDEKSYMLHLVNITPPMFDGNPAAVVYFGETSGAVPLMLTYACTQVGAWSKHGSDIFSLVHCIGSGGLFIAHWPVAFANNYEDANVSLVTANAPTPGGPIPDIAARESAKALHANGTALYVLCNGAEFTYPGVFALNKSSFALIDSWDITNVDFADVRSFHVHTDTLIYLLGYGGSVGATVTWKIGVLDTTTGITTTLASVDSNCTNGGTSPSYTVGFHYANDFFWIGADGGNVLKVGPY